MKLQRVLSEVRKAVDDYHMIAEGDKIAVGISGGKDSLTLLYALRSCTDFIRTRLTWWRSRWILALLIWI